MQAVEQLMLVDRKGTARATLALVAGVPSLSFTDEKNRARIMLGVREAEPFLNFTDSDGMPTVGLRVQAEGSSGLALYARGQQRAGIGVGSDGSTTFALYGDSETPRAEFGLTLDSHDPMLRLYDENNTLRAVLGTAAGGRWGLVIFDENGNVLGQVP
jgi:hypothetical protein